MGREDQHQNIAGVRFNPEHIETILCQLEGINAAVVMLDKRFSKAPSLVAFIQGSSFEADNKNFQQKLIEIKNQIAVLLPVSLRPSRFILKSSFPLTANGKVDRSALLESLKEEQLRSDQLLGDQVQETPRISSQPAINLEGCITYVDRK